MYILQLNQTNFLLTPSYIHKIQFTSNKLRPSSISHGQLRELVFIFSYRGSNFLQRRTRLFVEPYRQSDLSSCIDFRKVHRSVPRKNKTNLINRMYF